MAKILKILAKIYYEGVSAIASVSFFRCGL